MLMTNICQILWMSLSGEKFGHCGICRYKYMHIVVETTAQEKFSQRKWICLFFEITEQKMHCWDYADGLLLIIAGIKQEIIRL